MKNKDEIDDLFASSFGNFEEMPPTEVKANLDAQLFPVGSVTAKKTMNWKWFLFIFPITAFLAFVFVKSYSSKEKLPNLASKNNVVSFETKKSDNQQAMHETSEKFLSKNSKSKSENESSNSNQNYLNRTKDKNKLNSNT